jgi:hypothetical protein
MTWSGCNGVPLFNDTLALEGELRSGVAPQRDALALPGELTSWIGDNGDKNCFMKRGCDAPANPDE